MTRERRNPGARIGRDFRFRYSHTSRTDAATANSKFVSAEELKEAIIALSTAYAAMARELERREVFKISELGHVLLTTADSTDGLKQLILKSLGSALMTEGDDLPGTSVFRSGEAVH
jgi:hypothetical protein